MFSNTDAEQVSLKYRSILKENALAGSFHDFSTTFKHKPETDFLAKLKIPRE